MYPLNIGGYVTRFVSNKAEGEDVRLEIIPAEGIGLLRQRYLSRREEKIEVRW